MEPYKGRVALVTGGGSGIGRALAEALGAAGALVAVSDIDLAGAQDTADAIATAGGTARAFALDVTSDEQWHEAVAEIEHGLGPIDILCSNAGCIGSRKLVSEMTVAYMRWLFDVNVLGGIRGVREVVPGMKARKRGWVLFTGSMASLFSGANGADYSGTKHAVLAMADALRKEVAGLGINVSLLCPASVPTNLLATTRKLVEGQAHLSIDPPDPEFEKMQEALVASTGGFVSAEETARLSLEALSSGQFFVLTHPESVSRALERYEELKRDLEKARAARQFSR